MFNTNTPSALRPMKSKLVEARTLKVHVDSPTRSRLDALKGVSGMSYGAIIRAAVEYMADEVNVGPERKSILASAFTREASTNA